MKIILSVVSIGLFAACGEDAPGNPQGQELAQCQGGGYVAFDTQNHVNQDLRVGAYAQMMALMDEARANPALAAEKFAAAQALYEQTAELRAKVQGRKDYHLPARPVVGTALDSAIMAGFAEGAAATDVLGTRLAKQKVDKTLVEFFFLSVYYELMQGAPNKWDEAYGYYGAGSANEDGERRGLALVAEKRDGANGTNLGAEIFNGLVDGACAMATALDNGATPPIDVTTVPALAAAVQDIDAAMQRVLAYSVGHEAFEMVAAQAGGVTVAEEAGLWVKLAELAPYFAPLERLMRERGGVSLTRAEAIRAEIQRADFANLANTAWMADFDAAAVIELLEAEYGIDVRG